MNATIKSQRVHWCVQCEEKLPARCVKCQKHPDRKPRIVEVFDAPKILKTNECGCIGFRCQNPACSALLTKLVWRHPKADGTLPLKNHFCSPACTSAVNTAAHKAARVKQPCSCGCGRIVDRPVSLMKMKHAYFSQKCHYAHVKEEVARRKKAAVEAACDLEDPTTGLLECAVCKTDTVHDTPRRISGTFKFPKAKCQECGTQRSQDLGATMLNRDAMAITMLSRA